MNDKPIFFSEIKQKPVWELGQKLNVKLGNFWEEELPTL
jgi:hypothetical protein